MLTDVQKGMIHFRLSEYIRFLINHSKPEDIIALIQQAYDGLLKDDPVPLVGSGKLLPFRKRIPVIARELTGIFHPNFEILNRLFIIGNERDPIKITQAYFTDALMADIREHTIQAMKKIIACYPRLYAFKEQLSFFGRNDVEEVVGEASCRVSK